MELQHSCQQIRSGITRIRFNREIYKQEKIKILLSGVMGMDKKRLYVKIKLEYGIYH
jgi:hypothetical protein